MMSLIDLKRFDFSIRSVQCHSVSVGSYEAGSRSCHELVYKIDGCSRQYFDDMTLDLVPDSIYIIPRTRCNRWDVIEEGSVVNVYFSAADDGSLPPLRPEIIPLGPGNKYKNQFLSAARTWNGGNAASYFRTHAIVSGIFADLVADREKQYLESAKYRKITPAVEYIQSHFREPISVAYLTGLCGISDEYLRTLFHAFIGQTPVGYINTLRLKHACGLLADPGTTVAQAAAASGFNNVNYFARLFKKRYHIPPGRMNGLRFYNPYAEVPKE